MHQFGPLDSRRQAACGWRGRVAYWLMALVLIAPVGCKTFGFRRPVPDEVAASRELSQQGIAAMEMGQWIDAEQMLRKSIDTSPSDSVSRRHLAEALWRRSATEEALLQMEAAVRLDPSDASMKVRAGEMMLATGSTDKALQRAEEAIGLDPRLASGWALRGRVRWKMNQLELALADLQRALQYAPDSSEVLLDISAVYRQRGQHARCLTTLQHLLDTYPPGSEPAVALMLEGQVLADLGRPQQAIESLQAATHRGPPNAEVLYQLAEAQWASGYSQAAMETAQQALEADTSHVASRELLARVAANAEAVDRTVR